MVEWTCNAERSLIGLEGFLTFIFSLKKQDYSTDHDLIKRKLILSAVLCSYYLHMEIVLKSFSYSPIALFKLPLHEWVFLVIHGFLLSGQLPLYFALEHKFPDHVQCASIFILILFRNEPGNSQKKSNMKSKRHLTDSKHQVVSSELPQHVLSHALCPPR